MRWGVGRVQWLQGPGSMPLPGRPPSSELSPATSLALCWPGNSAAGSRTVPGIWTLLASDCFQSLLKFLVVDKLFIILALEETS